MLDRKQGIEKGIIINSISAAIYYNANKPKDSLIMVSYSKGNSVEDIRFVALKLPTRSPYKREDFIKAICSAEEVRNLTYVDHDGKDKDIYICRPKEGDIYEFVDRDEATNRYVEGFAEIESSHLKFTVDLPKISAQKPLDISFMYSPDGSDYMENSLEYATVNAFNACLLGRIFSSEEFQLETGDGDRVKYEVRRVSAKYIDISTLYIHPDVTEGNKYVSSYITEPMNVINGDEMMSKVYTISYNPVYKNYYIRRIS